MNIIVVACATDLQFPSKRSVIIYLQLKSHSAYVDHHHRGVRRKLHRAHFNDLIAEMASENLVRLSVISRVAVPIGT